MKKILLPINANSQFAALKFVIELLKNDPVYTPLVVLEAAHRDPAPNLAACREMGVQSWTWEEITARLTPKITNPLAQKALKQVYRFLPWTLDLLRLHEQLRDQRGILDLLQPDLVILPHQAIADTWAPLARRRGIPTLVIPAFNISVNDTLGLYASVPHYRQERMLHNSLPNRLVGRLYPRWVADFQGERFIANPWHLVLAREWLGLASRTPWAHNANADRVAAPNQVYADLYIRNGIPTEKLTLTGYGVESDLYQNRQQAAVLRRALDQRFGFPPGDRLICCVLPSNQYSVGSVSNLEFEDYLEMLAFYLDNFKDLPGWQVVFKPHPRSTPEELALMHSHPGAAIVEEDTSQLLPLSDLLVSYNSNINGWALACGVPILDYDVFHLRREQVTPLYSTSPGVVTVYDKDACLIELARITTDEAHYQQLLAAQQAEAPCWGSLDGRTAQRFLDVIASLLAEGE